MTPKPMSIHRATFVLALIWSVLKITIGKHARTRSVMTEKTAIQSATVRESLTLVDR